MSIITGENGNFGTKLNFIVEMAELFQVSFVGSARGAVEKVMSKVRTSQSNRPQPFLYTIYGLWQDPGHIRVPLAPYMTFAS